MEKNHQCPQPRGKGLGGSSNLNYMIYTRCHPDDFENNTFWSYDKLLPYYIKVSNKMFYKKTTIYKL